MSTDTMNVKFALFSTLRDFFPTLKALAIARAFRREMEWREARRAM
jgi:hypothetical protein